MADYKRFVSYMYEYENGNKEKNVGYARVETRNGECRFTIHMQLDGLPEGVFPTYMIYRPKDEMDLVYLGDCTVKNQVMDSRLSAKEYNIMDSGHRFSDMGGILLFLNSGVFYATEWDDKPVILEEVLHALKPKPIIAEAKMPEKKVAESIPVLVKNPTASAVVHIEKPTVEVPISDKNPLDIKTDTSNRKEDAKESRPSYILPGGGMMGTGLMGSNHKARTNPWELVERYKEAERKKVTEAETKLSESELKGPQEAPAKDVVSENIDDKKLGENPLAARIFTNFPRIYPFEDSEITRCVKVEPKDIGALPSDTWILSNNSFLLHGFYCYHHLIFAEIKDRYGCHYILGVPGIYHNRERFMARMFGFECFKSIRKRELKLGDFGYWYLEVAF
ncbi:MAG: DUF6128 domain-containing protein [Herbinix sp.]|nr:DUF6128 domain-containing protein [Herbinix sp.]